MGKVARRMEQRVGRRGFRIFEKFVKFSATQCLFVKLLAEFPCLNKKLQLVGY